MEENKRAEALPEVKAAIAALSTEDKKLLAAVQESPYRLTEPEQFLEFKRNTDCFVLDAHIRDLEALGWEYLDEKLTIDLTDDLKAAIDPVPFGKHALENDGGCFTSRGYLMPTGDEWQHERAAEHGEKEPEKKPSIRERLEQGKKECADRQAKPQARGKSGPEL